MSQRGQVARRPDIPAQAEPGSNLAELLDPVALEARLAEARTRRAEVMARRAKGEPVPPAPARPLHGHRGAAPVMARPGPAGPPPAQAARIAAVLPRPRQPLPREAPAPEAEAAEPAAVSIRPRIAVPVALLLGVAAGAAGTAAVLGLLAPRAPEAPPPVAAVVAAAPVAASRVPPLPGPPAGRSAAAPALSAALEAVATTDLPPVAQPEAAAVRAALWMPLAVSPEAPGLAAPAHLAAPAPGAAAFPATPAARLPSLGPAPAGAALPAPGSAGPEVAALVAALATPPAVGRWQTAIPEPALPPPAFEPADIRAVGAAPPAALGLPAAGDAAGPPDRDGVALAEIAAMMSAAPRVEPAAPRLAALAGSEATPAATAGVRPLPAAPSALAGGPATERAPGIADDRRELWPLVRFAADLPGTPAHSAPLSVSWAPDAAARIGYPLAEPPAEPPAAAPAPVRAAPAAAPVRARQPVRAAAPRDGARPPNASAQAKLVERVILENAVERMLRQQLRGN